MPGDCAGAVGAWPKASGTTLGGGGDGLDTGEGGDCTGAVGAWPRATGTFGGGGDGGGVETETGDGTVGAWPKASGTTLGGGDARTSGDRTGLGGATDSESGAVGRPGDT